MAKPQPRSNLAARKKKRPPERSGGRFRVSSSVLAMRRPQLRTRINERERSCTERTGCDRGPDDDRARGCIDEMHGGTLGAEYDPWRLDASPERGLRGPYDRQQHTARDDEAAPAQYQAASDRRGAGRWRGALCRNHRGQQPVLRPSDRRKPVLLRRRVS